MKAFPINSTDGKNFYTNTGMDLRDYFAAKALQALLGSGKITPYEFKYEEICTNSYKLADAMMEARNESK